VSCSTSLFLAYLWSTCVSSRLGDALTPFISVTCSFLCFDPVVSMSWHTLSVRVFLGLPCCWSYKSYNHWESGTRFTLLISLSLALSSKCVRNFFYLWHYMLLNLYYFLSFTVFRASFWETIFYISTDSFHSVLWHCFFGEAYIYILGCKNCPWNDLLYVWWDVRLSSLTLGVLMTFVCPSISTNTSRVTFFLIINRIQQCCLIQNCATMCKV